MGSPTFRNSPASARPNWTPRVTWPSCTSRHGMTRLASIVVVGIVPGEIVRNHPEFKSTAFAGSEIYEVAISLTSNIRRMPGCQVANPGDSEHASAKPRLMRALGKGDLRMAFCFELSDLLGPRPCYPRE